MSSLKVLMLGNSPRIMLYTSRFQLAKSVQLYHVSSTETSVFQIETLSYGVSNFDLKNHFVSLNELKQHLKESSDDENNTIFDLICFSASSLKNLANISRELNDMININTKIFIESTNFVQLEPFVANSLELKNLPIFSIMSDFDIRQIDTNHYKQFQLVTPNHIYLGISNITDRESYPDQQKNMLKTFARLFEKLFPHDKIEVCKNSSKLFLQKQWDLALPRICFDPLLIVLDESNPRVLSEQVLAQPLISGLINEIFNIIKNMGLNIPDTEKNLINNWVNTYPTDNDMPALLHHFIEKSNSLDVDLSLLQPILLADDFNLTTPYLEFLYSVMSQYQRYNNGKSKWFTRKEDKAVTSSASASSPVDDGQYLALSNAKDELQTNYNVLQTSFNEKVMEMKKIQQQNEESNSKIDSLNQTIESLKNKLSTSNDLQKLREESNNSQPQSYFSSEMEDLQASPASTTVEDMVSPSKNNDPEMDTIKKTDSHHSKRTVSKKLNDREKELELRQRELELQEKELELKKLAMEQQQQDFDIRNTSNHSMNMPSGPGMIRPSQSMFNLANKTSAQNLKQMAMNNNARAMYGPNGVSGAQSTSNLSAMAGFDKQNNNPQGSPFMNNGPNFGPNGPQGVKMGNRMNNRGPMNGMPNGPGFPNQNRANSLNNAASMQFQNRMRKPMGGMPNGPGMQRPGNIRTASANANLGSPSQMAGSAMNMAKSPLMGGLANKGPNGQMSAPGTPNALNGPTLSVNINANNAGSNSGPNSASSSGVINIESNSNGPTPLNNPSASLPGTPNLLNGMKPANSANPTPPVVAFGSQNGAPNNTNIKTNINVNNQKENDKEDKKGKKDKKKKGGFSSIFKRKNK